MIRILTCTLAAVSFYGAASAACSVDNVDLRGDWGQVAFNVEVADDAAERGLGLMNRESLPKFGGMLFVYERPQNVSFWMKNTLIPLDMIFLDETGVVQRVHENAVPLDLTPVPGGADIQYVLEVNGGTASMFGIVPGDVLRHPSIEQDIAAWACD